MTFREHAAIAAMSALVGAVAAEQESCEAYDPLQPISEEFFAALAAHAWTIAGALDRARPAGSSSYGAAPSASGPARQPGPYSEKP